MLKTRLLMLMSVCLTTLVFTPPAHAQEAAADFDGESVYHLRQAYNQFGFKLVNEISHTDFRKNIFISPACAAFALAMLYNGAEGASRDEMAGALELGDLSIEAVNTANASLLSSLNDPSRGVEIEVANSIWCRDEFHFRSDFLDRTRQNYSAKISALNFDHPRAVKTINDWVKEKTRGRISRIVDTIDPLDEMFLINAVYFKGTWAMPFMERFTGDSIFHRLDGSEPLVPMMRQTRNFRYFETEEFQAIRLPYGSGSFSMLLFLPSEDYKLETFVTNLNPARWAAWRTNFSRMRENPKVNIVMPRFRMTYRRSLLEPLRTLGMKAVFDPNSADLTGLLNRALSPGIRNLFVSKVVQKTILEVNEEGTEAAAATSVGVTGDTVTVGRRPQIIQMIIDRPFFCFIVDENTGLILFMGAIVDPS